MSRDDDHRDDDDDARYEISHSVKFIVASLVTALASSVREMHISSVTITVTKTARAATVLETARPLVRTNTLQRVGFSVPSLNRRGSPVRSCGIFGGQDQNPAPNNITLSRLYRSQQAPAVRKVVAKNSLLLAPNRI